jgi:hypothetical protein
MRRSRAASRLASAKPPVGVAMTLLLFVRSASTAFAVLMLQGRVLAAAC